MIRAWSMSCAMSLLLVVCAPLARADGRWGDEESDQAPACDPIDSQCDVRWGFVVETAVGISREESEFNYRAGGRFNFPLSNTFEVRTDLVLGGFPGFSREVGGSHSRFGASARVHLQLDVGSVYTLGVGADLVLTVSGGLVGAHVSFLGFRFGPKREFLVSLPQQLWVTFSSSIVLEQMLSVGYLLDF